MFARLGLPLAHAQAAAGMALEKAVPLWETRFRPEAEKKIKELGLSAWSRDRVEPEWTRFDKRQRTNLTHDANLQRVQADKQVMMERFERDRDSGNFEGALGGIEAMVAAHHLSPEQGQVMKVKFEGDVQVGSVRKLAEVNPGAVVEIASEGERTGVSKELPIFNGRKEKFAALRKWATGLKITKEVDTQHAIGDRILKGEIVDEAGVRSAAGAFLTDAQVRSLTKLVDNDPDYDATAFTQLRTAVRAFNPRSNQDHGTYDALQERIRTSVPKVLQKEFSDELYQAWQGRGKITPESVAREQQATIFARVDAFASAGFLGKDKGTEASVAVGMKSEMLKTQIAEFIKKNPEASPKMVGQHVYEIMRDGGLLREAARIYDQRGATK